MELYTGTPLQGGTALEVLSNGDGTYPRLWADLRAATRSINVQLYFSKRGAVADTMAAVLAERARAGVRVRLLLDAFGSQPLKGAWADSLSAAGVDVRFLRRMRWYKLDRVTSRSHVRAIVVDARIAYGGGFGLADYWLGGGRVDGEWREENVRFEGPAVAQAQAAFGVAWTEATGELLTGELLFPEQPLASPGVRAAFMLTSPTKGSTPAERFLALSIAGARRTLYIGNSYFLPDDDFRRLLREAVARGVDVRVLTASTKTDIMSVYFASRWRYEELLRAGVRIYEYQPTMIHSKTLVADGLWSAVGSMNFDNRSLALNDEANLVALDREVGATMDSLFLADLAYAREITLADFRRRPWWHRPLEGGAALLSRVL
jgi:cardiolipin synthase